MLDFVAWPKIPRLHKDILVTEKIDGTNACVIIEAIPDPRPDLEVEERSTLTTFLGKPGEGRYQARAFRRGEGADARLILVGAQSRNRLITPEADNAGFARWAFENAEALLEALGVGRHYGEWWGSGIQRGYGLQKGEKRFSLFNIRKYLAGDDPWRLDQVPGLGTVPVLYEGPFSEQAVEDAMQRLDDQGSVAAPGFKPPEGVVVFHEAAQQPFKWTFDDSFKGATPDSITVDEYAAFARRTGVEPLTKSNGTWTN